MTTLPAYAQRPTASFRPEQAGTTRPIVLSRSVAATVGGLVLAVFAWAGASTYYILFRDEVAQRFFAHETEMRFAYEDRIADLGGRLAREVTQGMVERTAFAQRAEVLAARLGEVETRQTRLQALGERFGTVSGPVAGWAAVVPQAAARSAPEARETAGPPKPLPLTDPAATRPETGGSIGLRDRLSAVEDRLGTLEASEVPTAKVLGAKARERMARLRSAILATGLDLDRRGGTDAGGIGGPLVPWTEGRPLGTFGLLAADIETDLGEIVRLQRVARALPLGQPIAGPLEETSPFGYRQDPFTRTPALHTGVDLRIEYGGTIRATASGRVTVAEYSGGYGNLVEIDHGQGVATRYGHLSAYLVAPGERVEAGQPIGRAGSTGRSTGSHVHYETRINGEPVNPTRFLQAGQLVGPDRG